MGAFFLYKSDQDLDLAAVHSVFEEKGFGAAHQFELGEMTLWLYPKQLVHECNYRFSARQYSLFVTGTVAYKGRDYRESLTSMLEDYECGKLEQSELAGAFCLIFVRNNRAELLTDRSNMYHVFSNAGRTIISSSFLALVAGSKSKQRLNRMALLEQLVTGFIAAPETSIAGISVLNSCDERKPNGAVVSLMRRQKSSESDSAPPYDDFDSCVDGQLEVLWQYYQGFKPFAASHVVDIGLSGGYDSRLNLLLAAQHRVMHYAHTHASNEHLGEMAVADALAKELKLPLRTVPIMDVLSMTEEDLEMNLEDSFFFFDGRTNRTMGTLNDVHTRKYRVRVLGECRLGLNGMGGELYRNYNHSYRSPQDFSEWLEYQVLDPFALSAIEPEPLHDLQDHLWTKYNLMIDMENGHSSAVRGRVDRYAARRYYAQIYLPYAAGVKSQAENQLAYFLMPFTEQRVAAEALKATPYIGSSGKLEVAMMQKLNPAVASIPSTHGFGLDREPLSYLAKTWVRYHTPDKLKSAMSSFKMHLTGPEGSGFTHEMSKHHIIRNSVEALRQVELPVCLEKLFVYKPHFLRAVAIGYFLQRFSHKIEP